MPNGPDYIHSIISLKSMLACHPVYSAYDTHIVIIIIIIIQEFSFS